MHVTGKQQAVETQDRIVNIRVGIRTYKASDNKSERGLWETNAYYSEVEIEYIQMFGSIVLGVPEELFEARISARLEHAGVARDTDLSGEDWRALVAIFKGIVHSYSGEEFPSDPYAQLELATLQMMTRR